MLSEIEPQRVKAWLSEGAELGFADVREYGRYAAGHPFFSVSVPYSQFEHRFPALFPNPRVPIVIIDEVDGTGAKAAAAATDMGYTRIVLLKGGIAGWSAAGYTLFDGVNVRSKVFGELIELARDTPHIEAAELDSRQQAGDDLVVLDGRTPEEFQVMRIPGGCCCPNGELALRFDDTVTSAATTVVVNCAGRTRSIIGAQTLIDLGVPNPVVALKNGTQGWALAGLSLDEGGVEATLAVPKLEVDEKVRSRAVALARRRGVGLIDAGALASMLSDQERTTYVFDIRTREEYARDGLPWITHAPGGQLIQATDRWIGLLGARVVVADDELVRAPVVAQWLSQLGFESYVLEDGLTGMRDMVEPPCVSRVDFESPEPIEAGAIARLAAHQLVDLRPSMAYRAAHLDGAIWSIRPMVSLAVRCGTDPIVLVGDDPDRVALVAHDLREQGHRGPLFRLAGGPDQWRQAGLRVVKTPDHPEDADCIDYVFHTHDRHRGNLDAAREYLAWEIGLVDRIDAQERGSFRLASG